MLKSALKNLSPPYKIDSNDETLMAPCTLWSENEPLCQKEVGTITSAKSEDNAAANSVDKILHQQFKLIQDDCEEGEIKIVFYDDNDDPGYLSYNEHVNSSVTIGDDSQCFVLKHNLCGPNSISFESVNDAGLVLTSCNGIIKMMPHFDSCG